MQETQTGAVTFLSSLSTQLFHKPRKNLVILETSYASV